MKFRVGPWVYRIRLVENLVNDKGEPISGLCDGVKRIISIDAAESLEGRLSVLLHELRHAYQFEFGHHARTLEDDANLAATFTADVSRQFMRQGGENALMRLRTDGTIDREMILDGANMLRNVRCPACRGYLEAPLRTGPATFDLELKELVAERRGDCEFCNHTIQWKETTTSQGYPTGNIVGAPVIQGCDTDFAVPCGLPDD